jgi:hypothetical protein
VHHRGGHEEDELAALDRRLEGGGVVDVRLEQRQPLRRAGQPLQQRRLLLVPCSPGASMTDNCAS